MNDAQKMNIDQFQGLLETNGSDPLAWPETDRIAAEKLLAENDEAQQSLARAKRFSDLLAADATMAASPDLRAKILVDAATVGTAASENAAGWSVLWPFGPIWRPATALAFATVLGIYVGIADPAMVFVDRAAQASVPTEMIVLAERSGLGLEEVE